MILVFNLHLQDPRCVDISTLDTWIVITHLIRTDKNAIRMDLNGDMYVTWPKKFPGSFFIACSSMKIREWRVQSSGRRTLSLEDSFWIKVLGLIESITLTLNRMFQLLVFSSQCAIFSKIFRGNICHVFSQNRSFDVITETWIAENQTDFFLAFLSA